MLGAAAAEDLKRGREGGRKFLSVEEVSEVCTKVSKTHIDQLKNLGALGRLPQSRQISIFDGDEEGGLI